MHRSYLFAPGHNTKLLAKVFDAGADHSGVAPSGTVTATCPKPASVAGSRQSRCAPPGRLPDRIDQNCPCVTTAAAIELVATCPIQDTGAI